MLLFGIRTFLRVKQEEDLIAVLDSVFFFVDTSQEGLRRCGSFVLFGGEGSNVRFWQKKKLFTALRATDLLRRNKSSTSLTLLYYCGQYMKQ